jgi:hypothetical protein
LLHYDPFDRALLSQAQVEALTLVTRDDDMHMDRAYHAIGERIGASAFIGVHRRLNIEVRL